MGAKRSAQSLAAEKKYKRARGEKPSAAELAREFGLTESAIRKSSWFKAPNPRGKAAP